MVNAIKNDNLVSVLNVREREICGEKAIYRLIKIDLFGRDVYVVTVSLGVENVEAIIGDTDIQANKFFLDICENSVTPCTFFDIFSDFNSKIQ